MFRYSVSAFLVAASAGIVAAVAGIAAPPADAWWSRALLAFGSAADYAATRTVMLFEELDEAGSVKSYERGETRMEWSGADSKVIVVSAEKNGKDAAEEWRRRYAKPQKSAGTGSSGGPPPGFDATPFDPKYSNAIRRGAPRESGGLVEVPYAIATDGGKVEGIARFTALGDVVSIAQEWIEPPVFVSSMRMALDYSYKDGALVVSGMVIEGQASVLLIRRRFRMSFEFYDWVRKPL